MIAITLDTSSDRFIQRSLHLKLSQVLLYSRKPRSAIQAASLAIWALLLFACGGSSIRSEAVVVEALYQPEIGFAFSELEWSSFQEASAGYDFDSLRVDIGAKRVPLETRMLEDVSVGARYSVFSGQDLVMVISVVDALGISDDELEYGCTPWTSSGGCLHITRLPPPNNRVVVFGTLYVRSCSGKGYKYSQTQCRIRT